MIERTDVAIVGAGPIGLELAALLKRAGVDYLHFEKGQIGQTISWFPREMHFFSSNDRLGIAGLPIQNTDQAKVTREQYLAYLRHVALSFDLKFRCYEPVVSLDREDDGFRLVSAAAAGERITLARKVVLVTGNMHGPRLLGVPGEDLPHVSHYFEEPHSYFGRRLLVVGGRNSAVEAALRCYHAGARVAISYRRPRFDADHVKYWILPELEGRIEREEIAGHLGTQVRQITATHVTLADDAGQLREVAADAVLLLVGYRADMTLFRQAGARLRAEGEAPLYDRKTMATSVPNLYVAGTAVAGTQSSVRVFIENCHIHAQRIAAALTGAPPPAEPSPLGLPES